MFYREKVSIGPRFLKVKRNLNLVGGDACDLNHRVFFFTLYTFPFKPDVKHARYSLCNNKVIVHWKPNLTYSFISDTDAGECNIKGTTVNKKFTFYYTVTII